ncbi:leucine-rich repeat domain-containing protein [Clostridium felsineum]|uniref:leucine-rich repeat domain-containing protein n=1 Tax=Clostridium felsineum TaxID=36839 RepID=UPI00214D57AB|nr:leucine-rich repeat domain-containing protein [Clostridium felsineum]MCR3761666.1 leucine-rich repeat domain-containing protein [Clostridium felsineum]
MKKLNSKHLLALLACFIVLFTFNICDTYKAETTVGVTYDAHVQNIGWQPWVSNGEEAGTDGQGLRVEAIRIRLVKQVHPDSISLNKSTDTLDTEDSDVLTANFTPDSTTNKDIFWTSSDPNIVSVDDSGKITAVADGTGTASATITATSMDGQKKSTCLVTVNKKEPIHFKDANLDNAVREQLNKPNGKLYPRDVCNITELNSYGNNIHYLDGIENLSNLKTLGLSYNAISDITPLKNLTNLQTVYLDNNYISDLTPLSSLTNLTGIILTNNPVSNLTPLSNLTNLKLIFLDNDSNLKDITPITKLPNLTYLTLVNTKITDLSSLNNLKNLQQLDIEGIPINDSTTLNNLKSLKSLSKLCIFDTGASSTDIASLKSSLPNCEIIYDSSQDEGMILYDYSGDHPIHR